MHTVIYLGVSGRVCASASIAATYTTNPLKDAKHQEILHNACGEHQKKNTNQNTMYFILCKISKNLKQSTSITTISKAPTTGTQTTNSISENKHYTVLYLLNHHTVN